MEMAPEGVFSRAARGGEYPKWLIKVAEYVVTTPLDIEIYQKGDKCQPSLSSLYYRWVTYQDCQQSHEP